MTTKTTHHTATATRFVQIFVNHKSDPYAYGGTSLTIGADCSGIIYRILTDMGFKNVPRTAAEQADWLRKAGTYTKGNNFAGIQTGEVIFFHIPLSAGGDGQPGINHVGVYKGNGQVIQESGPNGAPATIVSLASVKQYAVGYGKIPGLHYGSNTSNTTNLVPLKIPNYKPQTNSDWAVALLEYIGIEPTNYSIAALTAQAKLEGVNPLYNNPLGLKNANGVIQFKNWQEGIAATAKTIKSNPAMITALENLNSNITAPNVNTAVSIWQQALKASNWEGFARPANNTYAAKVASVMKSMEQNTQWGRNFKNIFSGPYQASLDNFVGAAYPAKWWDPLMITGDPSKPFNPIASVAAAIEELAKVFGFFTSAKFWYMVLGGVVIIIGVYLLFHTQIQNVEGKAKKGAEVAAVAA